MLLDMWIFSYNFERWKWSDKRVQCFVCVPSYVVWQKGFCQCNNCYKSLSLIMYYPYQQLYSIYISRLLSR